MEAATEKNLNASSTQGWNLLLSDIMRVKFAMLFLSIAKSINRKTVCEAKNEGKFIILTLFGIKCLNNSTRKNMI